MEICALSSGSSGNCFYISSGETEILVDAGISCKQIDKRLALIGKDINDIQAAFITHEHTDHIRGIDTLSKRHKVPIYLTKGTQEASFFTTPSLRTIKPEKTITIEDMEILPFSKSHDAKEPVSYLVSCKNKKVGIMTDIGYACNNVIDHIQDCSSLILESNHDLNMLKNGRYPIFLKRRITSDKGHLSNYDAALLILEHAKPEIKNIILSHLSINNNTPEIAFNTFNSIIKERKDLKKLNISISNREKPTDLYLT